MSHIRTELELAEGLTVLVGPNNCGKSAVVEAIRTVCENSGKDFMVRHGEKQCRVTIETNDGHTIQWKRDKSVVSYTIDGRDIHRLGGGVPEDLHELLRLPKVSSPDGDDKFDIHIASQKQPLFLLDRSERESAMFFASSSDASLVMEMQRRHKQRWTERKRDRQQIENQTQACKQLLDVLDELPLADEKLRAAEELHDNIRNEALSAEKMTADLEAVEQQTARMQQLHERFAALLPLPTPPVIEDTRPLEQLLIGLNSAENAVRRGSDDCAHLRRLVAPPVLADDAPLDSLCRQLDQRSLDVSAGNARVAAAKKLAQPPDLADTHRLEADCAAIDRQSLECLRLQSDVLHLRQLLPPPELQDPGRLLQLASDLHASLMVVDRIEAKLKLAMTVAEPPGLRDLSGISAMLESCQAALEAVKTRSAEVESTGAALAIVLASIQQWAEVNPSCPVCGGPVDAETLITAGGHNHG